MDSKDDVNTAGDVEVFSEDQWWLPQLDTAVANGTKDQKRAVAVVRNMLGQVTRLNAELADYMRQTTRYEQLWIDARKERDDLQSELATARELFRDIANDDQMWTICSIALARRIDEQLAHQSAPAGKCE